MIPLEKYNMYLIGHIFYANNTLFNNDYHHGIKVLKCILG